MRVKIFSAPTMAEAMQEVRERLGKDAIIISTHRGGRGRGVQITAAIEDPAPQAKAPEPAAAMIPDNDVVYRALLYHRTPGPLAELLAAAARSTEVEPGASADALARALDARFTFSPVPESCPRPIMVVGPPGAGKTVTVAKLAARAVIAGRAVHLVTTDTVRAGGVEQLAAFTRILEQPLAAADTPDQLRDALAGRDPDALCLIDSPGTNPFAEPEVADLMGFLSAAEPEIVLVMAAGSDALEAAEAAEVFAGLGARRSLFTRVDVARRLGGLLAAADAGGLSLCNVSVTPLVAEGLSTINPVSLARLLMRDPGRPVARPAAERAAL